MYRAVTNEGPGYRSADVDCINRALNQICTSSRVEQRQFKFDTTLRQSYQYIQTTGKIRGTPEQESGPVWSSQSLS
jgi:hypothetical protein